MNACKRAPRPQSIALALSAALALAVFFRVYQIDRIPPPSLHVDEAFYGVDAIHVMQGQHAVFFEGNNGREPLFIYLAAGWFSLFGIGPVTFRLLSCLIGTLTVLAMFWLGREVFWDDRGPANGTGLAAAILSAFLYANVSFGRSAQRVILYPLMVALVTAAMARCLRTRRARDAALTGVLLGASFYTYSAVRIFPIAVGLAFGLWWLWERDSRFLVNLVLVVGVSLAISAPLGLYFLANPDSFFFRASQVVTAERLEVQVLRTLRMFGYRGDADLSINLRRRPLLDPIQAAWGLLGLAVGWVRGPHRAWVLTLLVLAVTLIPPVISMDAPAFGKSLGSVPPLLLLLAVGLATPLEWAWRWVKTNGQRGKWVAVDLTAAAAVALTGSIWITFRDYFLIYGRWGELPLVFQQDLTSMGNLILGLPADERILISPFHNMPATLTFTLHGDDPRVTAYDGRACVVMPDTRARNATYLVILEDHNTLPALIRHAPNGQTVDTKYFLFYQVLSGTRMQPMPQFPLQARWAEPIELLGYDIGLPAGGAFPMILYWRAAGQIEEPYTVFVHLVMEGQNAPQLRAQYDAPPCNTSYATQDWQVGDIVAEYIRLGLPADIPAGDYALRVGLYHTYLYTRLALISADHPSQDHALLAGTVHLAGTE